MDDSRGVLSRWANSRTVQPQAAAVAAREVLADLRAVEAERDELRSVIDGLASAIDALSGAIAERRAG